MYHVRGFHICSVLSSFELNVTIYPYFYQKGDGGTQILRNIPQGLITSMWRRVERWESQGGREGVCVCVCTHRHVWILACWVRKHMRAKSKFVFRKIKFPLRRKFFLPKHVQGLGISAWQACGRMRNALALLGWLAMGGAHVPPTCLSAQSEDSLLLGLSYLKSCFCMNHRFFPLFRYTSFNILENHPGGSEPPWGHT